MDYLIRNTFLKKQSNKNVHKNKIRYKYGIIVFYCYIQSTFKCPIILSMYFIDTRIEKLDIQEQLSANMYEENPPFLWIFICTYVTMYYIIHIIHRESDDVEQLVCRSRGSLSMEKQRKKG